MSTLTKTMTAEQIKELKEQYRHQIIKESQPDYTYYQIKTETITITAYTSGKVVFQGKDLPAEQPEKRQRYPQAGSDEVGTGDYFGPVVVCAAIVEEKNVPALKEFGVQDSKQINDEHIRKIAPAIQKLCPHSILIVDNEKYNEIQPTHNMVDIKSKLHNQAYVNLTNKGFSLPDFKVVDQFVREKTYYGYVQYEPVVIRGLHFETKAENRYIAVATASILARYAFLKHWDGMEEQFDFSFPKGAGVNVDKAAKLFVRQYGMAALRKVAKLHFKNTKKLVG